MSSNNFDAELTGDDSLSEVNFQDLSQGSNSFDTCEENFSTFPKNIGLNDEREGLLNQEEEKSDSFWKFSYYQRFFDVDTNHVLQRIVWSMIPAPGRAKYFDRHIRPPDLYGPFWICTTLVFSIAISANIADFLKSEGRNNKVWHYDFHKVSLAATAIYSYAFLIPLAIWALVWYRKSSTKYTLLEILCVYGYSLFIYIPISILWVIQVTWLQWLLVICGASVSGLVLLQTFSPFVRNESNKVACGILILILLLHILLAVGFVTYFFQPGKVSETLVASIQPSDIQSTVSLENLSIKNVATVEQLNNTNGSMHNMSQKENFSVILNSTEKM